MYVRDHRRCLFVSTNYKQRQFTASRSARQKTSAASLSCNFEHMGSKCLLFSHITWQCDFQRAIFCSLIPPHVSKTAIENLGPKGRKSVSATHEPCHKNMPMFFVRHLTKCITATTAKHADSGGTENPKLLAETEAGVSCPSQCLFPTTNHLNILYEFSAHLQNEATRDYGTITFETVDHDFLLTCHQWWVIN